MQSLCSGFIRPHFYAVNPKVGAGLEKPRFLNKKIVFKVLLRFFLGFNLQMANTKIRPYEHNKSKDESSEQIKSRPCERHKSQFTFEYHLY